MSCIENFIDSVEKYIELKKSNEQTYIDWINETAENSKYIKLVSHVSKFTHSSIRCEDTENYSNDILIKKTNPEFTKNSFKVSSFNLNHIPFDACCNSSKLAYAGFLLLVNPENGNNLIQDILKNDLRVLQHFSKNNDLINKWVDLFKLSIDSKGHSSHVYAKQVYFPISQNSYHLLSPLFPSSLYHAIYKKNPKKICNEKLYEEYKELKLKKQNSEYSDKILVYFTNLVKMRFGGANPQVISYLNSKRNGEVLLLKNEPPVWKHKQIKEYLSIYTFWKYFFENVFYDMKKIIFFLSNEKRNNYEIRKKRETLIFSVLKEFINYLVQIKENKNQYFFSDNIKNSYFDVFLSLKKEDSFNLKVYDFIESISYDFSYKFINRLSITDLDFKNGELIEIKRLIKKEINELIKYKYLK